MFDIVTILIVILTSKLSHQRSFVKYMIICSMLHFIVTLYWYSGCSKPQRLSLVLTWTNSRKVGWLKKPKIQCKLWKSEKKFLSNWSDAKQVLSFFTVPNSKRIFFFFFLKIIQNMQNSWRSFVTNEVAKFNDTIVKTKRGCKLKSLFKKYVVWLQENHQNICYMLVLVSSVCAVN